MKTRTWLAAVVVGCLLVPAAFGSAMVTQGSNEIGISGQLDTAGVGGTEFDLRAKYAYFFWDRISLGLRGAMGNDKFWNYFSIGGTVEYNFTMPKDFRPLIGTDLVPVFIGGSIDYRHVKLESSEHSIVFGGEIGTKLFLTDSTAVVFSMIGEIGTADIYYDETEETNRNLLFQLGLRFYF